jgi:hypothetical protein
MLFEVVLMVWWREDRRLEGGVVVDVQAQDAGELWPPDQLLASGSKITRPADRD